MFVKKRYQSKMLAAGWNDHKAFWVESEQRV